MRRAAARRCALESRPTMLQYTDYNISTLRPYINWLYFYHAWGLSGKPGSAEHKAKLLNALGLPPRLSKKELVEAFNRLYTFEQLDELQLKILQE